MRLRAYGVTEMPRHADPHSGGSRERDVADPGRAQRAAALTAAYHAGLAWADKAARDTGDTGGTGVAGQARELSGAVAFGWVRTAAEQAVRVIAAGDALTGSTGREGGEVLLALPSGARGVCLAPGELDRLLAPLGCWREVAGISDGLRCGAADGAGWRDGREGGLGDRAGVLSLDEALLGSWTGPFGWMVTAEPLAAAQLRTLAAEAGLRQRLAEGSADRFAERATLARRLKERHAELERGISMGFWRISVTAGGTDEASAARVAGLLCASVDLGGLPYALSPGPAPGPPPSSPSPRLAAWPAEPGGDGTPASPFYGSTELLAALTRPPESEVPGVRLALRPEFDVTPDFPQADGIELGTILDRNLMPAGRFAVPAESLNRHVFVCGATGAGKSQTVRTLLEAATARGIPWLVIEPAKAEYRLMAARLPDTEVIRIRPGEPDAVAAGLNPLEPAVDADGVRFPLQTHADLIKALFIASFQAEEPFPQVLSAALGRVYEEAGWDLALGEPVREEPPFPTLTDLQRTAERVVSEIGYSQRVTDDVLGFIRVRLASLRHGTTGRFVEGGHPLDFAAVLRKNVVLEIEDVGDDGDKAFLMGAVLIRLVEYLRLTHRTVSGLRHLTVVEEAHRLLRRSEPGAGRMAGGAASHAVEMFAGLLAEIRAYGEGLIIAEQIPARLAPDAIKNTAVKIVHRLPAADDREAVGATMNATPAQSRYLVTLPPGRAAVFSDGMDFPILVQIDDGSERERASLTRTADTRSVVDPRSAACGSQCTARPCTLRDLRTASRTLDEMPWVRAWAELSVLGHLTGWPAPVPKPEVLAPFAGLPARLTQCALSHAVQAALDGDALAAARPAIPHPSALAVHVTAALSARTERGEWRCDPDEPEWLLPGPVTSTAQFDPAVLASFISCGWPGTMEP